MSLQAPRGLRNKPGRKTTAPPEVRDSSTACRTTTDHHLARSGLAPSAMPPSPT